MTMNRPLFPIAIIALVALVGLFAGLTGETWEDGFANLALALCLLPIGWALFRKRR